MPKHQDVTVDTRVHVPSISVFRIANQLEVLLGNIDDPQRNLQLGCGPLGLLEAEKGSLKTDGQDFNPLIL